MIKIKHFHRYEDLEKFANDFELKHSRVVVKKDIKIVVKEGKVAYYLVLDYWDFLFFWGNWTLYGQQGVYGLSLIISNV